MASDASFPRRCEGGFGRLWACWILALVVLLIPMRGVGQQTAQSRGDGRQTSKTSPLLLEAQDLLRKGSINEAKAKIQEELQQNPSSVEAYNLLGIAYSDEKDYINAPQAFQQALKLEPKSTRTHNNLGNLYVAEEKLDLAETEFRTVLRIEPG